MHERGDREREELWEGEAGERDRGGRQEEGKQREEAEKDILLRHFIKTLTI